jgi:hypothetical protein
MLEGAIIRNQKAKLASISRRTGFLSKAPSRCVLALMYV